jgi:hypothetical protein
MKITIPNLLMYMKVLTAGTLITGIYLHLSRLVFGMENFQHFLFTPVFEIFFALPMIAGAVLQLLSIKKIGYKNSIEKIVFIVCTFQFVVSVPLHIRAYVVGSTNYIHMFPPIYSLLTIIMWSFFIYVIAGLKIKFN